MLFVCIVWVSTSLLYADVLQPIFNTSFIHIEVYLHPVTLQNPCSVESQTVCSKNIHQDIVNLTTTNYIDYLGLWTYTSQSQNT